jgi:hypothetical protein
MLSEVHGLKVAGNKVLTKIFEPKRDEIIGDWEKSIMRSLIICSSV